VRPTQKPAAAKKAAAADKDSGAAANLFAKMAKK
jgi:hypothetical protein